MVGRVFYDEPCCHAAARNHSLNSGDVIAIWPDWLLSPRLRFDSCPECEGRTGCYVQRGLLSGDRLRDAVVQPAWDENKKAESPEGTRRNSTAFFELVVQDVANEELN